MKGFSLAVGLLLLTACQTTPFSADDEKAVSPLLTEDRRAYLLLELDRQRDIWNQKKPINYKYVVLTNCFCFPAPRRGPIEISVMDENIVRRIYSGLTSDGYKSGDVVSKNLTGNVAISDLFESVQKHLVSPNQRFGGPDIKVNFTVGYDPIWGFPSKIFFDAEQVLDEQYSLTIQDFTVVE